MPQIRVPSPIPRAGNLKNVAAGPPPATPQCCEFKIANLKCVFLKKYWDDFYLKIRLESA
jgi:hypothetical protein